jgi:hypothetical protein
VVVPPGTSYAAWGRESIAGLLTVARGPRSEGHPAPHRSLPPRTVWVFATAPLYTVAGRSPRGELLVARQ